MKRAIDIEDSITFSFEIVGTGNLNLLTPPVLESDDFKIYQDKNKDKSQLENKKQLRVFSYALIPLKTGQLKIPSVEIEYFNTETKSFEVLKAGGEIINVSGNPSDVTFGQTENKNSKGSEVAEKDRRKLKRQVGADIISNKTTGLYYSFVNVATNNVTLILNVAYLFSFIFLLVYIWSTESLRLLLSKLKGEGNYNRKYDIGSLKKLNSDASSYIEDTYRLISLILTSGKESNISRDDLNLLSKNGEIEPAFVSDIGFLINCWEQEKYGNMLIEQRERKKIADTINNVVLSIEKRRV